MDLSTGQIGPSRMETRSFKPINGYDSVNSMDVSTNCTNSISVQESSYEANGDNASRAVTKPFKCSSCVRLFTTKDGCQSHMEQAGHCPPMYCAFCSQRYRSRVKFGDHMVSKHPEWLFRDCDTCGCVVISPRVDELHQEAAEQILLSCDFCRTVFTSEVDRYAHEELAHPDRRRHKCYTCARRFRSRHKCEAHMDKKLHWPPLVCQTCHSDSTSRRKNIRPRKTAPDALMSETQPDPPPLKPTDSMMVSPAVQLQTPQAANTDKPLKPLAFDIHRPTPLPPFPCPFCQEEFALARLVPQHLQSNACPQAPYIDDEILWRAILETKILTTPFLTTLLMERLEPIASEADEGSVMTIDEVDNVSDSMCC